MAIDYVKFQRGTQNAYNRLLNLNRIDENTLYFIYSDKGGKLYLGNRLISGEGAEASALSNLTDVVIKEVQTNSFLILNQEGVWTNISLNEVINLIKNNSAISDLNKQIAENRDNIEDIKENITELSNNLTTEIAARETGDTNTFNSAKEYVDNRLTWEQF